MDKRGRIWIIQQQFKKIRSMWKKGLDGIEMLYPIENKQKKLEKEELNNMIGRLYEKKKKRQQFPCKNIYIFK